MTLAYSTSPSTATNSPPLSQPRTQIFPTTSEWNQYPYGNPYVHWWSTVGANVQDYGFGTTATGIIVDGPKGAFYVGGDYHAEFVEGGYAGTCGAPIDNVYSTSGNSTRQDFLSCYMTQARSLAEAIQSDPLTRQYYGRPPLLRSLLLPPGAQAPARKYLDWHREKIFDV